MPRRENLTPPLQECFHCGALAPPGKNPPAWPCIACRIEMKFGIARRWALSLRYEPRRLFVPFDLVRFARRKLLIMRGALADVPVEVSENCLRELPTSSAQGIGYDPGNSRRKVSTSRNRHHQESALRLRELLADFSRSWGNHCALCQTELGELGGVDMALPVHLNHSNIATERRRLFWKSAMEAGLVMLCCPACNFKKGVLEKAGLSVLWGLFHGRARWQEDELCEQNMELFKAFSVRQLMFDGFTDEADVPQSTQTYPADWPEVIAGVFQAFALRVSCVADLSQPQLLACCVRDDATQITFVPAPSRMEDLDSGWGTPVGIVQWPDAAER